ncbi:hypothetical protein Tco_0196333 [Tanacetum coccineum]
MDDEFLAIAYPKVHENLKLITDERVIEDNPESHSGSISSMKNLKDTDNFGDQFLYDKPTEDDQEKSKVADESDSTIPDSSHQTVTSTTPVIAPVTDFSSPKSSSLLRVARLEQEMSEVKKTDHSADVLASIKSQVPTVVDKYLGTKLDDALLRILKRHTADLIEKYSMLPGPESIKNQESKKSPKEIIRIKKEQGEEKQDSTYSIRPFSGSNQGKSAKGEDNDSGVLGQPPQPPTKYDKHKITDTRDAVVNSSMHRSDPESEHFEQSSDDILMQVEGHVSDLEDIDNAHIPKVSQVPTVVDKYLGTKLDDALLRILKRHTADLIEKYSMLPGPESIKNQESKKSPKEIIRIKKEQGEEKQDSTYSIRSTDKVALEEFDLKNEDAMDKEVKDRVKNHKRKHDSDDDEDDDDDEGPSAGSNQGKSAKRRRHDSGASGSAQPPTKYDEQSSKKPRESDASASKQHPALTSTGW